ncbi:MAG: hypothetical protein PF503_08430 [Desulfobacula sp.]|jgi:predicted nuclease with TOPRIM domain|nr:hypothetical protein [Desulfobacula sp.]
MIQQDKERQNTEPTCIEQAAREEELKKQLEKIALQNNDYLHQIKKMDEELENLKRRLFSTFSMERQSVNSDSKFGTKPNNLSDRLKRLEDNNFALRDSYSFRIGQIFIDAVSKPGKNTIMLPFRFIGLIFDYMYVRKHT